MFLHETNCLFLHLWTMKTVKHDSLISTSSLWLQWVKPDEAWRWTTLFALLYLFKPPLCGRIIHSFKIIIPCVKSKQTLKGSAWSVKDNSELTFCPSLWWRLWDSRRWVCSSSTTQTWRSRRSHRPRETGRRLRSPHPHRPQSPWCLWTWITTQAKK